VERTKSLHASPLPRRQCRQGDARSGIIIPVADDGDTGRPNVTTLCSYSGGLPCFIRFLAINAHPLEKVKRAVSAGGECGNVYFLHHCACLQRRLKQGLIPMHQVLQKSKRENTA
jgi:hypothetical protein